jgi:hypothetical protein
VWEISHKKLRERVQKVLEFRGNFRKRRLLAGLSCSANIAGRGNVAIIPNIKRQTIKGFTLE